jgi:AcrR family transcriptional regulator
VARQRILSAALELLEDTAYAQVTTEAIAERAGASKATIYRWWPNKAAVLIEAFREAVIRELPFPDTGSLREDVRLQLRNFVRMLNGRRGRIFGAFLAASQNDPEVGTAFRLHWLKPRRHNAKVRLERSQERGILRKDVDLDHVLDLMYGPIYFRLLVGHGPLSCAFADSLADMALEGLIEKR